MVLRIMLLEYQNIQIYECNCILIRVILVITDFFLLWWELLCSVKSLSIDIILLGAVNLLTLL